MGHDWGHSTFYALGSSEVSFPRSDSKRTEHNRAAEDSKTRSFSDPVLLFWFQWSGFKGVQIQVFLYCSVWGCPKFEHCNTAVLHSGWKLPPHPQNTSTVVGNLKYRIDSIGSIESFRNTTDRSGQNRSKKRVPKPNIPPPHPSVKEMYPGGHFLRSTESINDGDLFVHNG
jgi:hypothetical protein